MYVEYDDGFRELYDLTVDPYELDNLAVTASPDVIQALSKQLAGMASCAGAECRVIEDSPLRGDDLARPGVATDAQVGSP